MSSDKEWKQDEPVRFTLPNGIEIQYDMMAVAIDGNWNVYPMNNGPFVDVSENASREKIDAAYAKRDKEYEQIYEDAKAYFDKNPSKNLGYGTKTEYISEYLNVLATEHIKKRVKEGKSSILENAYLYQIENKCVYCAKQLKGEMPLDAPLEEVKAQLKEEFSSSLKQSLKNQRKLEESIKRGYTSLKGTDRLDQKVDGRKNNASKEEDYTKDEVNYMIYDYINNKSK